MDEPWICDQPPRVCTLTVLPDSHDPAPLVEIVQCMVKLPITPQQKLKQSRWFKSKVSVAEAQAELRLVLKCMAVAQKMAQSL